MTVDPSPYETGGTPKWVTTAGITTDVLQHEKAMTAKTLRIYLSGPMTSIPLFNWPEFEKHAALLRNVGHHVVSPAEQDELNGWAVVTRSPYAGHIWKVQTTPAFDFATAIKEDLGLIDGCDAIYMLKGWSKSLGAGIERDHALVQGKQILFAPDAELLGPREPGHVARLHETATLPGPGLADIESVIKSPGYVSPRVEFNRPKLRPATGGEVRVVDPKTGGEKGSKLAQMGAVDPLALLEVGKVAGFGATKYARYNFAKGYAWSLSFDAMQRHLMAFWAGEDKDPESGLPHAAHAAWHGLALVTFLSRGLGTDDRFPRHPEAVTATGHTNCNTGEPCDCDVVA